jgi:hypothetical protein
MYSVIVYSVLGLSHMKAKSREDGLSNEGSQTRMSTVCGC